MDSTGARRGGVNRVNAIASRIPSSAAAAATMLATARLIAKAWRNCSLSKKLRNQRSDRLRGGNWNPPESASETETTTTIGASRNAAIRKTKARYVQENRISGCVLARQ